MYLVGVDGIEPSASRTRNERSTDDLHSVIRNAQLSLTLHKHQYYIRKTIMKNSWLFNLVFAVDKKIHAALIIEYLVFSKY